MTLTEDVMADVFGTKILRAGVLEPTADLWVSLSRWLGLWGGRVG